MRASFPQRLLRRAAVVAVIAGAGVGLWPQASAWAEVPVDDRSGLRWRVPSSCPDPAHFAEQFRELRTGQTELPPASSVEVVATADRFELRLAWLSEGGLQRRRFLARDCSLLIELAAITLAIESVSPPTMPAVSAASLWTDLTAVDLDPSLDRSIPAPPMPSPPTGADQEKAAAQPTENRTSRPEIRTETTNAEPQLESEALAVERKSTPPAARALPRLRHGLEGVVTLQAGFLDVPSRRRPLGLGGSMALGLDWRPNLLKIGMGVEYWLPAAIEVRAGEVRIQAFAIPMVVCVQPRLGRFELSLCGIGRIAGFWGRAVNIEGAVTRGRFGVMGSAGLESALLLPLSSTFAVSVGSAVLINWARPRFGLRVVKDPAVYQPGPLGVRAFVRMHIAFARQPARRARKRTAILTMKSQRRGHRW